METLRISNCCLACTRKTKKSFEIFSFNLRSKNHQIQFCYILGLARQCWVEFRSKFLFFLILIEWEISGFFLNHIINSYGNKILKLLHFSSSGFQVDIKFTFLMSWLLRFSSRVGTQSLLWIWAINRRIRICTVDYVIEDVCLSGLHRNFRRSFFFYVEKLDCDSTIRLSSRFPLITNDFFSIFPST